MSTGLFRSPPVCDADVLHERFVVSSGAPGSFPSMSHMSACGLKRNDALRHGRAFAWGERCVEPAQVRRPCGDSASCVSARRPPLLRRTRTSSVVVSSRPGMFTVHEQHNSGLLPTSTFSTYWASSGCAGSNACACVTTFFWLSPSERPGSLKKNLPDEPEVLQRGRRSRSRRTCWRRPFRLPPSAVLWQSRPLVCPRGCRSADP